MFIVLRELLIKYYLSAEIRKMASLNSRGDKVAEVVVKKIKFLRGLEN